MNIGKSRCIDLPSMLGKSKTLALGLGEGSSTNTRDVLFSKVEVPLINELFL